MKIINSQGNRGFILNIVAIAVVIAMVILSQIPLKSASGGQLEGQGGYREKVTDWVNKNIYSKVDREVTERGEVVKSALKNHLLLPQDEIFKQKDFLAKGLWEKIKNYFAEKFSGFFGTKVE